MATVWFCLLAFMITVYVVLDGFDLGVGALHRILSRDDAERDEATRLIGPVWDGNEVWLIAAGGVLFLGFPKAYAAAFSGLYFGLIIVLWLLVGRGLGLELRHQSNNPLWQAACDTVFWLSSAALAVMFGVALGNVVRGVPLGPDGYFKESLFHLLNWYGLLIGLFGLVVLSTHGASFLAARASSPLAERAQRAARRMWWAELLLTAALAYPTYSVRHAMFDNFGNHPWRLVFPVLALGGLAAQYLFQRAGHWGRGFLASCVFILGMLATAAAGLYPNILPAREGHPNGLTIHNAASGHHALVVGLRWWSLGIVLAIAYFIVAYRFLFGAQSEQARSEFRDAAPGAPGRTPPRA
ncbi:MAG: cytochrome bd ubiquinol oxidase subunit [Chloroflexota bacterium]|nr:cytochrome bd ubiquinol oxidase subunit [Chloroflexota bacterium]